MTKSNQRKKNNNGIFIIEGAIVPPKYVLKFTFYKYA